MKKLLIMFLATLFLVSCAGKPDFDVRKQIPAMKKLITIEAPQGEPIVIAVYDFIDMTGQKKPGGNFASMSTAVTQGAYQILIKALQDAGDGKWFRVVERASLPSLLQERKLIRSTRQMADGDEAVPLPPLLFAGAYLTGGIIGYDSDVKSGGIGARILGIQAHKQYRQDIVTIILRLVNVQSGEVIISIVVEKTIFSGEAGGDIFKYFDADTLLLETEVGVARNEPVTYAVRKAIEKGIVELILEGDAKGIWEMEDPTIVEDFDSEVKTEEEIKTELVVEQSEQQKVKTREEYLAEKKAKKEAIKAEKLKAIEDKKAEKKAKKDLKKVQKNELAWYNKTNGTKFKTWDEYQQHLKTLVALENKKIYKEELKKKLKEEIKEEKDWAEVDKEQEENTNEEINNDSGDSSSNND